jgi:hypothetical protein
MLGRMKAKGERERKGTATSCKKQSPDKKRKKNHSWYQSLWGLSQSISN